MMNFCKKKLITTTLIAFTFGSLVFASDAYVVSCTGKVEVQRGDQWVSLKQSDSVSEGELISTGFKSELVLKYQDSVMKLGPLTRITLEKLSSTESKDSVSVYLNTGTIRSTVNHATNKRVGFVSRNPVAVASVRGTDFMMTGDGAVTCYQGGVNVVPSFMFDAGKYGIINPADGSKGATQEQADLADNVMPKDGETTSFTQGVDINPNEPVGVVITGGQFTNITDGNGIMPSSASNIAASVAEKIINGASSLSELGNVMQASSQLNRKSTGKLVVTVQFPDDFAQSYNNY